MLKFIFLCLFIVNALLFAMWQGYLVNPILTARKPQQLTQQQNSQYLKLISAQVANSSDSIACLELGPFAESELAQAEAKLATLSFGNRQTRQALQETTSTMVFIPSLGSKAAAEKKVAELTKLGINDFYLIQDQSNLRWGISLGVFKSEEAAKQLVTSLTNKGVRNVKTKVHSVAANRFIYIFQHVSDAEKSSLENIKAEFSVQYLRQCTIKN